MSSTPSRSHERDWELFIGRGLDGSINLLLDLLEITFDRNRKHHCAPKLHLRIRVGSSHALG